ncbi:MULTISPECIES: glycoside hydrolase family 18 protein [Paenibacillus]|uniref:chitinase n=1 Tax=Paenibacillus alvei TaxID=44250 RepID=A0ABT4EGN8_PAEAL|nr:MULTISPECIES: glycoside hydrolase family 18 protein [Paenibacillus]EPY13423.1 Chitinase [Paenibacillus alvei A6-6i-x]MCY9531803.1 glycoside hydrolase family 18 protein [Paenibacillus alvei]SDG06951.1 chitinase [Paenibacillus sp. cl6col]
MSSNKLILAGYAGDPVLPNVTAEDAKKLTHLNVAFGHVKNDRITIDHLQNLSQLQVLKSYNPELLILLSVGGWSAGGFSEAASTAEGRRLFAESAVRVLETAPFDGIDLDWEYPCYSEAGIASSPNDKQNFTLLLKELREVLDAKGQADGKHYLLTIAAGADQYYIDGTEMDVIHSYLDFIQLMTYDMRGGFQTLTGHHTNLYTSTGDLFRISVDASVRLFAAAGVPREKIVIGAAFYSRMWKDVPNTNNGYLQMAPGSGGYGPDYTKLVAEYINKNGFVRHWDEEAKSPYLYDGHNFITYDDPESLTHKCKYVMEQGIAGVMFWEYSCDHTHTLLDAMYRAYTS